MNIFSTRSKKQKQKQVQQTPPVPRELPEIQKLYSELTGKAGQLEYQMYMVPKQLKEINEALESLNYEAAARKKLNAETQAADELIMKKQEVTMAEKAVQQ